MINLFFPKFLVQHIEKKYYENEDRGSQEINLNKECLSNVCQHSTNCDICQKTKQNIKKYDVEFLVSVHEAVKESGLYNFEGCKIPINTKLNIQYFRSMLADYKDYKMCVFFGIWFSFGLFR